MLSQLEIERELEDYFGDQPWFSEEEDDVGGDSSSSSSATASPPRPGTLSLSSSMKAPRAFQSLSPLQLMRIRLERLTQRREGAREDEEEDEAALPRKQEKLRRERQAFEERRLEIVERQSAPELRRLGRRDYVPELDLYFTRHEAYCDRLRQITRMSEVQAQLGVLLNERRPLSHHSTLPNMVPSLLQCSRRARPVLTASILLAMLARWDCLVPLMASQSGTLTVTTFESEGLCVFIAMDAQSHALQAYVVIRTSLLLLL